MSADRPTVIIELLAWATVFVGGDGNESREFPDEISPGDTIRDVLKRLSRLHRDLDEALWDRRSAELSDHIEIAVNDATSNIRLPISPDSSTTRGSDAAHSVISSANAFLMRPVTPVRLGRLLPPLECGSASCCRLP